MKKTMACWIAFSMMVSLCAVHTGAAGQSFEYSIEENTAENRATYPYVVHTESATWYLSKDDIALLGEEAFFRGLYDLLEYQEADFADARAALSGFISEEVEPIIRHETRAANITRRKPNITA